MSAPAEVTRWLEAVEKNRHREVPADLVLAMIWQESTGNPWAYRYENGYVYFYEWKRGRALYDDRQSVQGNRIKSAAILGATEFNGQSASWGLMQPMGAAARERGFRGLYLPELCEPEINISIATAHYWIYASLSGERGVENALQRYNGGGNEDYFKEVLEKRAQL